MTQTEKQAAFKDAGGDNLHHGQGPFAPDVTIESTLDANGRKPNPWGKGHIKLYAVCTLVYLCSTMSGYDTSLMGSINAIPEFHSYYNLGKNGATETGIVFSIFQIGSITAALFLWISDWRGRRFAIVLGCFGCIVGGIFTAAAPNLPSFIGARYILSFSATIAGISASILLVEVAPPLHRATVAGLYNTLYYLGNIVATFAVYGSNLHLSGNLKWRLPLWIQIICPGIVCLCCFWLPESPRWLLGKGRDEEARRWITEHWANGDPQHPVVELEMREITHSLRDGGTRTLHDINLRPLFASRARLYRLMLVAAWAWCGQFSGNSVIAYYLPVMLINVGITSTNLTLLLNACLAVANLIFAVIGARLHDRCGRRIVIMSSFVCMIAFLAVIAATTASYEHSGSFPSSSASIAFIFAFAVASAIGITPMQAVYAAEVLSNDMRASGMIVFQIVGGIAGFINTFAAPTALNNISYWFYVFFIFWDILELGFIYTFFVETKGRTLEELDAMFEAKDPRKTSTRPRTAASLATD